MLRASTRTTGRTWLIQHGEPTFINTMVIPHTGKTCPSRRKPRLSRESGRLDLTGRPIFHQRTAIICESWMSFWDPSNSYPSFQRLLRRYELAAIGSAYGKARAPQSWPVDSQTDPLPMHLLANA